MPVFRPAPLLLALAVVLASSCAPVPPPATEPAGEPPRGGTTTLPLVSSLSVAPSADSVAVTLRVTNGGAQPVRLEFRSGQTYDFIVTSGGRRVWHWAGDRGFTAALRTETLAAGETRTYTETWRPAAGSTGEYTAVARLVSTSHPVETSTRFRLP